MTLNEFVQKYENKFVDWDSHFGSQCVDLFRQYVNDVLVIPQPPGVSGANELFTVAQDKYWEKLTKNPRPGDVVIWGTGIGPWGHVAIYLNGDENNLTSFDQNFPVGTPCHKQNHNYKNILGYLRKKESDMKDVIWNVVNGFYREYYHREPTTQELDNHVKAILTDYNDGDHPEWALSEWVNRQKNEAEFKKNWAKPTDCDAILQEIRNKVC